MAQKKTFFEQPIDRTPYGACVWVIGIVLVIFFLLALGLWRVSGMVKKSLPKGSLLPRTSSNIFDQARNATQSKADEQAQAAKDRITDELNKQKDAAIQSAEEAAKQEAQKQIDQQVEKQKNQLQQFLP